MMEYVYVLLALLLYSRADAERKIGKCNFCSVCLCPLAVCVCVCVSVYIFHRTREIESKLADHYQADINMFFS